MHDRPFGLTLAAADHADGLGPSPRELELMFDFRVFGALPEPGALYDQPAGLLRRMRHAEQVWKIYDGWNRAASWKKWQAANPGAWAMKIEIDKARQATPNPEWK